ncbi:MAG: ComEC/Rec2 family competence protein [Lishizhenia sp.]
MLLSLSKTIVVLLLICSGYSIARTLPLEPSVWLLLFLLFLITYFILSKTVDRLKFWRLKILSLLIYLIILSFSGFNYSKTLRENLPHKLKNMESRRIRTLQAEVVSVNKSNKKFSRALIRLNAEYKKNEQIKVDEYALLYYENDTLQELKIGNKVLFNTTIEKIENYNNPGEFDAKWFWENKGITLLMFASKENYQITEKPFSLLANFEDFRDYLSAQLKKVCNKKIHAVASALLLGDKALLDRDTRNEFNTAGAMHVLAVSGLHVGILLLILESFFKQIPFLRKKKLYLIFAIIALWLYACLTGLSPSVIRATLMFSLLAFGQLQGKSMISLNIISFSALIMLLINPRYLFDIGFQLSYVAMFSISLFYLPIARLFQFRYSKIQKIWEGLAVCFAAQIGTIPLTLYYFHQFPNYFILTNIGLIILSFICMAGGVAYLSVSFIPLANQLLGFIVFCSFWLLIKFIEMIYSLPGALAKGFELSILDVFTAFFGLILMHLAVKARKTKLFYMSCFIIFLLAVSINTERLNKVNRSHFAILNHNSPVLILNYAGLNYCFYDLLDKTNFEGTEYLVDSYSKYFGGEVKYINLKEEDTKIENEKFKLSITWDFENSGYQITINNENFFLPTEEYKFKSEVQNILTRTLKYSLTEASKRAINLAQTHFRISL